MFARTRLRDLMRPIMPDAATGSLRPENVTILP